MQADVAPVERGARPRLERDERPVRNGAHPPARDVGGVVEGRAAASAGREDPQERVPRREGLRTGARAEQYRVDAVQGRRRQAAAPGSVFETERTPREPRAVRIRLARQAHLEGTDLQPGDRDGRLSVESYDRRLDGNAH